jgi:hypothetical protein
MSISVSGIDGVLILLACLCFLVAAICAWVGHRLAIPLIALGLLLWALTGIVH